MDVILYDWGSIAILFIIKVYYYALCLCQVVLLMPISCVKTHCYQKFNQNTPMHENKTILGLHQTSFQKR